MTKFKVLVSITLLLVSIGCAGGSGSSDDADPSAAGTNPTEENCETHNFYEDTDGDGFGNLEASLTSCEELEGFVSNSTDCDDDDASINPSQEEICEGLVDENCDGEIDEGCTCTVGATQRCGQRGGVGTCKFGVKTCADGEWSACQGAVVPSDEICDGKDNDCDGEIDERVTSTFYLDSDDDGFGITNQGVQACQRPRGYSPTHGDCDDSNSNINPNADEECDTVDNNCASGTDEGCECVTGRTQACGTSNTGECTLGTQTCVDGRWGDCVDNIDPQPETCNGKDDDCDTAIDEDVKLTFYRDFDEDTYGSALDTTLACDTPEGYVEDNTDCDDSSAEIKPGQTEVCDEVDNDCDGLTDEDVQTAYYMDSDEDTYGDTSTIVYACSLPENFSINDNDCDDNSNAINPGASEICEGIVDENCSGSVDEGCECTNDETESCGTTDVGECEYGTRTCSDGLWGECEGAILAADEICDDKDNDCDGETDEPSSLDALTWYADIDNDGYGDPLDSTKSCTMPVNYINENSDCDDNMPSTHPGAAEICDEMDNDCDDEIDEGVQSTFYLDFDGDGYGDSSSTQLACEEPEGYASNSTDCNDSNALINPSVDEICEGSVDENCSNDIDEGCECTNGTSRDCGSDTGECEFGTQTCTDGIWGTCVGASGPFDEVCDGLDNDCDESTDEDLTAPAANKTNGVCEGATKVCGGVSGWQEPDYSEIANYETVESSCFDELDNDCDGGVDSGTNCTERIPPEVTDVSPADGTTDMPVSGLTITATFSEELNPISINSVSFLLESNAGPVIDPRPIVEYENGTATMTPREPLEYNTTYTITLTTNIQDLAGNQLEQPYTWTFTTVNGPWKPTSIVDAPTTRFGHSTVWVNGRMVIWGGQEYNTYGNHLDTGASYDPETDTWHSMSSENAPSIRTNHSAVAGVIYGKQVMIICGGQDQYNSYERDCLAYNPQDDTWSHVTNMGFIGRAYHTAIWADDRMVIWGGRDPNGYSDEGSVYIPTSRIWVQLQNVPSAIRGRIEHSMVWARERSSIIVWGGRENSIYYSNGFQCHLVTYQCSELPSINAPTARVRHAAAWNGSGLIISGGRNASQVFGDAHIYSYGTPGSWASLSGGEPPSPRYDHTAIVDHQNFVYIWGGNGAVTSTLVTPLGDGYSLSPYDLNWRAISEVGAPAARSNHSAVWTGGVWTEGKMIIWGGRINRNQSTNEGGIYDPAME